MSLIEVAIAKYHFAVFSGCLKNFRI